MTMPAAANPDMAFAERDDTMLRGGGMDSDRPYVTWGQFLALQNAGRGAELRKYALIMRMPTAKGAPGAGPPVAMPAEKQQKWYGQGFRPCVSVDDLSLAYFPPPPEPRVWLPSMVEESIARGEVIPEEMAPAGYIGPTMSIKAMREAENRKRAGGDVGATHEERLAEAEERAADAERELADLRAQAVNRSIEREVAEAEREIEAQPRNKGGRPRKELLTID